jgi:basic amino acid/polyamine antiporter, APA family
LYSPRELPRQLKLGSAVAIVVGEVIGVGIFLTPAGMAKSLGSPFWLLVVWLTMGIATLAGALCLGELAARYPSAGGLYVYLRQAYGSRIAFLFGWMSALVLDPGITAALAMGVASYVGYLIELSAISLQAVAVATILAVAAVNLIGVRFGARLLRWLTGFKLGVLVFFACWGFGWGLGDWSNLKPFVMQRPGSDPLAQALAAGMVAAFFSFGGWWDVTKMAGEICDPGRTLPRALTFGVLAVTGVYILVSVVFLYLVPLADVTTDQTFAAQAGEALFGRAGGVVFSVVVIAAVLSSLMGVVMGAPRVYYAMARDGLFLPGLAAIHPRLGTPARAIALQAVLSSVLVFSGTFSQVLAYFIFVAVVFLALTVAAVFVLPGESSPGGYRTPGYPWTPVLFLASTIGLLILLVLDSPLRALLGVAVVAIGIPVYHLFYRENRHPGLHRIETTPMSNVLKEPDGLATRFPLLDSSLENATTADPEHSESQRDNHKDRS